MRFHLELSDNRCLQICFAKEHIWCNYFRKQAELLFDHATLNLHVKNALGINSEARKLVRQDAAVMFRLHENFENLLGISTNQFCDLNIDYWHKTGIKLPKIFQLPESYWNCLDICLSSRGAKALGDNPHRYGNSPNLPERV